MGSHLPNGVCPTPEKFIEFAHIYADSMFDEEHDKSLQVMRDLLVDIDSSQIIVTAVMIDDIHVDHNTLNVNKFVKEILRRGVAPDFLVFEGKLSPVADQLIAVLPADELKWLTFRKTGKQSLVWKSPMGDIGLKSTLDGVTEHSCAILSAAWTACRSGLYDFPEGSLIRFTEAPTIGKTITSVLPSKYNGVEEKVLLLIQTIIPDVEKRIELVFFD